MSQPDHSMSGHDQGWEGQAHLRSGLGYAAEPDYFEDGEVHHEGNLPDWNPHSIFDDTEMSHERMIAGVANVQHSGLRLEAFRLYMPTPEPVSSDVATTVSRPSTTLTGFPIPGEPRFDVSLYGVSDNFDDLDQDLQALEDTMSDSSSEPAAADDDNMSENDPQEDQDDWNDNHLEMSEVEEDSGATTEEFSVQITSFLNQLEVVEGDCSICLGEAGRGPRLVRLPCSTTGTHAFHRACIGRWLENRSHCPYCRHTFNDLKWRDEGEQEQEEDDEYDDDDEENLLNELWQIGIPVPLQGLRGGDDVASSITELENVRSLGPGGPRGADIPGVARVKPVAPARLGDLLCVCLVGLLDAAFILQALGLGALKQLFS